MSGFGSFFGLWARRAVWVYGPAILTLLLGLMMFLPEGKPTAQAAEVIDTAVLQLLDDHTHITLSAFRYNRTTQTYLGTATVTNTSAEPLDAPLYLVVTAVSPTGASVIGATGLTIAGQPFLATSVLINLRGSAPFGSRRGRKPVLARWICIMIFCGVLSVLKSGCQWRMLPRNFSTWRTCYEYLRKVKNHILVNRVFKSRLEWNSDV